MYGAISVGSYHYTNEVASVTITMERWTGRVAVVTGASAGIGAAIAKELVLKGMKVVGLARRVERIEAMRDELKGAPGQLHPLKCDVTQEGDILAAFDWVTKNLGGVDVLVNNAGVGRTFQGLLDSPTERWRQTYEVNVLALSICTREAVKSMRERGVDDGHIVHINRSQVGSCRAVASVAGHTVSTLPAVGMYAATKHGVTALTEALRLELVNLKSRIRVSSISPGSVRTEIMMAAGRATTLEPYTQMACMEACDIAHAVLYVLGAPPHVQIHELIIKPVGELF